jgi:hypothetical protein
MAMLIGNTSSEILHQLIYPGTAGILPHIDIHGKFTMGKLNSSLISYSFVFNWTSLSLSSCSFDLAASVVFFISSFE